MLWSVANRERLNATQRCVCQSRRDFRNGLGRSGASSSTQDRMRLPVRLKTGRVREVGFVHRKHVKLPGIAVGLHAV